MDRLMLRDTSRAAITPQAKAATQGPPVPDEVPEPGVGARSYPIDKKLSMSCPCATLRGEPSVGEGEQPGLPAQTQHRRLSHIQPTGTQSVACQREGTSGLPRPRDHRVWSMSMVVSVLLVN
jgi:hypothetical protein